jgi:hypothetical protein
VSCAQPEKLRRSTQARACLGDQQQVAGRVDGDGLGIMRSIGITRRDHALRHQLRGESGGFANDGDLNGLASRRVVADVSHEQAGVLAAGTESEVLHVEWFESADAYRLQRTALQVRDVEHGRVAIIDVVEPPSRTGDCDATGFHDGGDG